MSKFYPISVDARCRSPRNKKKCVSANAIGTAAAFECGTYVKFYLGVGDEQTVENVEFSSNGCGFMVAAAEIVAHEIKGKLLPDLHGLDPVGMIAIIESSLGRSPADRKHCGETCIDALRAAFADLRARQIEEFAGEKPLICTCFGVPEEDIELLVGETGNITVEQVGERCNAGTGCGSCQAIIQEMIDIARRERL